MTCGECAETDAIRHASRSSHSRLWSLSPGSSTSSRSPAGRAPRSGRPTCLEPGGSACCCWNGYGTQCHHPAQGLTEPSRKTCQNSVSRLCAISAHLRLQRQCGAVSGAGFRQRAAGGGSGWPSAGQWLRPIGRQRGMLDSAETVAGGIIAGGPDHSRTEANSSGTLTSWRGRGRRNAASFSVSADSSPPPAPACV